MSLAHLKHALGSACVGLALTTLALGQLGCQPSKPAAPPPAPPAEEEPEPPPPPPPPPKCEALSEGCEAKDGTRVAISPRGATFAPPAGWLYAKEEKLTLATFEKTGTVLAFTEAPSAKPEDVTLALKSLMERLSITGVADQKIKGALKKPEAEWTAGSVPVKVSELRKGQWPQLKDPLVSGEPGVGLLVIAALTPELVIVGLGFQKSSVEGDPLAVKTAIESLRAPE
jgi:hypothetical protein